MTKSSQLLRAMFDAAIDAAMPAKILPPYLPPRPKGRLIVIGAGKASAAMAKVVEAHYGGRLEGLVITRYDHAVPCQHIEIVEASHPVPDAAGEAAARRILELVSNLSPDDLVLSLISGGGSALAALPADGVSLADKIAVNKALLQSGAPIGEMNIVRKHLSAIKGGRLAAQAFPAAMVSLMISDVPGDDPSVIASGPTVADPSSFADARRIIAHYGIDLPPNVAAHLQAAADETPKPGDPRLAKTTNHIVARPQQSLEAAAEIAKLHGLLPKILGDAIEGEARDVAREMAQSVIEVCRFDGPWPANFVLISGGETTVTVKGNGRGGRNVEFLLALGLALEGLVAGCEITALAGDTDGIDGAGPAAGAILKSDSLLRAFRRGLSAEATLANNDAMHFFEALDDVVMTGPTLTNVNDFRAVLIEAKAGVISIPIEV